MIELSQSQQSEMNCAPVADHIAEHPRATFLPQVEVELRLIAAHFVFCLFGLLLLSPCVLAHPLSLQRNCARLSLSVGSLSITFFCFFPPAVLLVFFFFFLTLSSAPKSSGTFQFTLPAIKTKVSDCLVGEFSASQTRTLPGCSFRSRHIAERYLAIFSGETTHFQQPEQK